MYRTLFYNSSAILFWNIMCFALWFWSASAFFCIFSCSSSWMPMDAFGDLQCFLFVLLMLIDPGIPGMALLFPLLLPHLAADRDCFALLWCSIAGPVGDWLGLLFCIGTTMPVAEFWVDSLNGITSSGRILIFDVVWLFGKRGRVFMGQGSQE